MLEDVLNPPGFHLDSVTDWPLATVTWSPDDEEEGSGGAQVVSPGLPEGEHERSPKPTEDAYLRGTVGGVLEALAGVAPAGSKSDPLRLQQPPRDSDSDALSGPATIIFQSLFSLAHDDQQVYEGWVEYWSDSAMVVQLRDDGFVPKIVMVTCNGLDGDSLNNALPRLWKGRLVPVANVFPKKNSTPEWVCLWWFHSTTECEVTPPIFPRASSSVD
jgi:hypothetical protein